MEMSAVQINVTGLNDYTKVHYTSWVLLLVMYTDELNSELHVTITHLTHTFIL